MAKFQNKIKFSIIFCQSVHKSNNEITWDKINFMFPPNFKVPTFKDLQNAFQALDTSTYQTVIKGMGLIQYQTTTSTGVTDTRYSELVLTSDLIYYIK